MPKKRVREEEEDDLNEEDLDRMLEEEGLDLEDDEEDVMEFGDEPNGNQSDEEDEGEEEELETIDPRELKLELAAFLAKNKGGIERKTTVDEEACKAKLEQIIVRLPNGDPIPWDQHFTMNTAQPVTVKDIQDDLDRETNFYQHTLASVIESKNRLEKAKIPYKRPDDFFAEMVKTDEHMAKVKQSLLDEKARLERIESATRSRNQKKFARELSANQKAEKSQKKKSEKDKINEWRKARSRGEVGDEFPVDLLEDEPPPKENKGTQGKKGGPPQSNKKRQAKDAKYKRGGRATVSKRNTRESTNDFGEDRAKHFQKTKGPKKQAGGRPGKNKRQKTKR